MNAPVMLSLGMGVDSAALLTRWLRDPQSRDFDLDSLIAVTAMTGDEYDRTKIMMQEYLLPLMAEHQVRYVQLARAGQSDTARYEVLSDSRRTTRMVMAGTRWRLRDEVSVAGTVPQLASGRRLCSYRAKGQVLDWWVADEFGGGEYRHVVGFAAEEVKRSVRDTSYTSAARRPWYPLIEWGWDRNSCLAYLRDVFGVTWSRSCCGFCPFQAGPERAHLCERWRREPAAAKRALQVAIGAGLRDLVEAVDAELDTQPWAVYDVRRAFPARRLDRSRPSAPGNWDQYAKGQGARCVSTVTVTTAVRARGVLLDLGGQVDDEHRLVRVWERRAGAPYPSREHFLVAAPAGVSDKVGPAFASIWQHTHDTPGQAEPALCDAWARVLAEVNP